MNARVIVLGTAQDGGVPHAACACDTCRHAHDEPSARRRVASIAIVSGAGRRLLVDATPDLPAQLEALARAVGAEARLPDAILLTHAHMGHVLGLAFLGREAAAARGVPLHVTDAMERFLAGNRPWSRLLGPDALVPQGLAPGRPVVLDDVEVEPFAVPHRAEDTDTVGLAIRGPARSVVYVPDADRWTDEVVARIEAADVALVDGTFHDAEELPGRAMAEVPHPPVVESVRRLAAARGRVLFTHLNHTNALLAPEAAARPVLAEPFGVAPEGLVLDL